MTDEELARQMYEEEAKNWPSPVGWDNMMPGSKAQWVWRVKQLGRKNDQGRVL